MNNKKIMVSFLIIILFLFLGSYYYFSFLKTKDEVSSVSSTPIKQNKHYIVYVEYNNGGSASSFVPLSLNPELKDNYVFDVSISVDDNGNIINDDKIIVIDNFVISDENKKMIKNIAGTNNYDEALKEIEEWVNSTKINLEKEGLIK